MAKHRIPASDAVNGIPRPPRIPAKFSPPGLGAPMIRRKRLERDIVARPGLRLATVRGPAGFGKTTLLVRWHQLLAEAGWRPAWITLDEFDNDPQRLLSGLAIALGMAAGFAGDVVDGNRIPPAGRTALPLLLDRLAASGAPVALFLDDFDALIEEDSVTLIRSFIRLAGPGCLVVVASRRWPDIGQMRLRLTDAWLDVPPDSMRFERQETTSLLEDRFAGTLSAADIGLLHDKTEGWPAALQLACVSIGAAEAVDPFLESFARSSGDLARYVAENVLDRQSEGLRDFLLVAAVPTLLNGALCDAITAGNDSARLLADLEASGLFLRRLDTGDETAWYRFHALFREFLIREIDRRQPGGRRRIALAAAGWFAGQGLYDEAADHARLAGDPDAAAAYLEQIAMSHIRSGHLGTVIRAVEALGAIDLGRYPRLFVAYLWAISFARSPKTALGHLDGFRARCGVAAGPGSYLADSFTCLEFLIAGLTDDLLKIRRQGPTALAKVSRANAFEYGTLANAVAHSFIASGDFGLARETLAAARATLDSDDHVFGIVYTHMLEGVSYLGELRLETATAALRTGLDLALARNRTLNDASAVAAAFLADALYEANELDQACDALALHLPIIAESGLPEAITLAYTVSARLALLRHDDSEADRLLYEAEAIGIRRHSRLVVSATRWELVRLAQLAGDEREAARLAGELGLANEVPTEERLFPPAEALVIDIAAARHQLWRGTDAAFSGEIYGLMTQAARRGLKRRHLLLGILYAMALEAENQHTRAVKQMAQMLLAGLRHGFVRSFLDEGQRAMGLIRAAEADLLEPLVGREQEAIGRRYRALLEAASADRLALHPPRSRTTVEPAGEKLTLREIEILGCLERGLTNRELADCLHLSETTVKWHLRNIFGKLGVGNRTEAVFSARLLDHPAA